MNPAAGPHRRVLVIVIALILYGSLYPWDFHARHYGAGPLYILLHSWPARFDTYLLWDVGVNVVLYLPLGIFGYLAVSDHARAWTRVLLPLTSALALSSSVEMLQLFDDSRNCSLSDVASNAAGAAIGIAIGVVYRQALSRWLGSQPAAAFLRPTGPLLLLSCWLGYQLFPLFPVWGRTSLFKRLGALEHISIAPVETLLVFAEWIAVACLLDSIMKSRSTGVLGLLLLVVPFRLLLASRALAWPDIVGAGAAMAVWLLTPRRYVERAAPMLLAGAVILGELRPFHFAAARPFHWLPFGDLFQSDWPNGFVVLFRKSFWYGSALWLWRGAGYGLWRITLIAAASLFLLERAQMHLAGRTPEITDAALALLMGALLWVLRDS